MDSILNAIESGISHLSPFELFLVIAALTFLQEDAVLLLCAALVAEEKMSFQMAFTANVTGVLIG